MRNWKNWLNAWDLKGKETAMKTMNDETRGYRDRLAGFYDKWYRYNREDDGAAYDAGCVRAVNTGKCPETFTIISSSEAIRNY
jgi:hypothetical protein